jgi:hypothetical protein
MMISVITTDIFRLVSKSIPDLRRKYGVAGDAPGGFAAAQQYDSNRRDVFTIVYI